MESTSSVDATAVDPKFESTVQQERAYLDLVHPTPEETPGCAQLFDTFVSCNVLYNQYKSLYRYGYMARCAEKYEDWRFCLKQRALEPDERREAWLRRRAEWWATRRLEKSSEDVWEMRSQPLEHFPSPLSPEDVVRMADAAIV